MYRGPTIVIAGLVIASWALIMLATVGFLYL